MTKDRQLYLIEPREERATVRRDVLGSRDPMPRKPNRRVCVFTGSRNLSNRYRRKVENLIDTMLPEKPIIIVGCARGLDEMVRNHLIVRDYPGKFFVADWDKLGKAAGHIRNAAMIDHAVELAIKNDVRIECYAFPLSSSPGTRNCMRAAKEAGAMIFELT